MKDEAETKEQLISELTELHQRLAVLKILETERKRAEEELQKSEAFISVLFDSIADFITVQNTDYEVIKVNKIVKQVFGNDVVGKKCYRVYQGRNDICPDCPTAKVITTAKPAFSAVQVSRLGQVVEIWASPVEDEQGNIIAVIEHGRDITERKQAEEALRGSEQNFRHSLDNSPLGIRIIDINAKGETIYANRVILDIYGYSSIEELKSIPAVERHTPKSYAERQERVRKREAREPVPDRFEQSIIRKDGEVRDLEVFNREVLWGGEKQFQLIYHDITDRKRAEEQLSVAHDALNSSVNGVIITGLEGDIRYINPAFLRIFEYRDKDEVLGKNAVDLFITKEVRKFADVKAIIHETRGETEEFTVRHKDGTEFAVEVSSSNVTGKEGSIIGRMASFVDVTERKQAEEREEELQKELNLASRLASVGKLAAGVAHEINNPLTGILAFSERLLRKGTDEKASRDLKRINDEAKRAARVVERLLTFARYRELKKGNSHVNRILRRALQLRAHELKTGNIEVELDLTPNLPKVIVDPYQIQEVFLSIIMNAEQAMTEAVRGGKLGIKTQQIKNCIRTSFTDDGPGISPEHLDRVFDPFFTTREREGGTGLGLSVCHGIVQRHDGRIYAKSKPGKGATFVVELPLTGEKVKEAKQS